MKALTRGHLESNGGIRGHSAGDYYPYRVMAQGLPDDLTWWVVRPNGETMSEHPFQTAEAAVVMAQLMHSIL